MAATTERSSAAIPRRAAGTAAAIVFVLAALVAVIQLAGSERRIVASNGVPANAFAVEHMQPGSEACLDSQYIPQSAGGLTTLIADYGAGGTTVKVRVTDDGDVVAQGSARIVDQSKNTFLPLSRRDATLDHARLCISADKEIAIVGNPSGSRYGGAATVDGRSVGSLHINYLSAEQHSKFSMVPIVFARAALWGPGWLGSWVFYLLVLLLPATAVFAAWSFARALRGDGDMPLRRTLLLVGLLTLVNGFAWTVVSPAFQAPDEIGHYAYVESIAERGKLPDRAGENGATGSYTDDLKLAVDTWASGTVQNPYARIPWNTATYEQWQRAQSQLPDTKSDGGGRTTISSYSPLYYAPAAAVYKLAGDSTIWSKLWAVRLLSLLLTIGTALLCVLFVRELLPGVRWAPLAAGMLAAFQPMFLHVGSSVNNDAMLFTLATATLLFVARILRRGLSIRDAAAVGLLLGLTVVVKPTGIAFVPVVAFAIVYGLLAGKDLPRSRGVLAGAAAFAAMLVPVVIYYATLGGGDSAANVGGTELAQDPTLRGFLNYMWQWYLPLLPGMQPYEFNAPLPVFEYFVKGAFANFNSLDTFFSDGVYWIVVAALLALWGGLIAWAVRERAAWRKWWPPVAACTIATVSVLLLVNVRSYQQILTDGTIFAQGRYLLPLIGIFCAFVVAGAQGFKRWAPVAVVTAISALAVLNLFGYSLTLGRYFL